MQIFKKVFVLSASCLLLSCSSAKKVAVSSDADAKIYVNGQMTTSGNTRISVPKNSNVNVKVEKVGFITQERNYSNNKSSELPKTDFIKLEIDDAYESSFNTDIANRDIDIKTDKSEEVAWKLMSQIVTNYFDVLEVTDKNTGYMRTAWVQKNFRSSTIRTRLIIKTGNTNPLTYKVKLISEIGKPGTSVKEDEGFKQWDRLLRSYEPVVTELQSRLTK